MIGQENSAHGQEGKYRLKSLLHGPRSYTCKHIDLPFEQEITVSCICHVNFPSWLSISQISWYFKVVDLANGTWSVVNRMAAVSISQKPQFDIAVKKFGAKGPPGSPRSNVTKSLECVIRCY